MAGLLGHAWLLSRCLNKDFLIFDVEVLFLLPFAVTFTTLPVGALVAMLVFILLLAEGLVWAWHRGHLEWK